MIDFLHRSKIIFLSIILTHSLVGSLEQNMGTDGLRRINPDNIEECKKKIKRELFKDKVKIGVGIGVTCAMVGGGYLLYNAYKVSDPVISPVAPVATISDHFTSEEILAAQVRFFKSQGVLGSRTFLEKVEHNCKWIGSQFSLAFFATLAGAAASPIVKYMKVFDSYLDRVAESLFYTADLTWFLKDKSTLWPLIDDIEQQANLLKKQGTDQRPIKDDEYRAINNALLSGWSLAINQLECILGFMQMKIDAFSSRSNLHADHAKSITNRVLMLADSCSIDMAYALLKEPHALYDIIHTFRVSLKTEFDRFVQCEYFVTL